MISHFVNRIGPAWIASDSLGPGFGVLDPDRCAGLLGAILFDPDTVWLTTGWTALRPADWATRCTLTGFRTTLDIGHLFSARTRAADTPRIVRNICMTIGHHLRLPKIPSLRKVLSADGFGHHDLPGVETLMGDQNPVLGHQQHFPIDTRTVMTLEMQLPRGPDTLIDWTRNFRPRHFGFSFSFA